MSSLRDDISEAWKNDIEYLRIVSELSGLPVAVWLTGKPLSEVCWTSCADAAHPCFSHEPLRASVEEYCRRDRPSIFFESDQVIYGVMPIGPFSLAIGPAAIWSVPEGFGESYARSHSLNASISLSKVDLGVLSRYMELIFLHFNGSALSREDISVTAEILEKWQSAGDLEAY